MRQNKKFEAIVAMVLLEIWMQHTPAWIILFASGWGILYWYINIKTTTIKKLQIV